MKEIAIEILPDGTVKIEPTGFKGKACLVTKEIEDALGTVTSRKHKPEFYQQEVAAKQKVGG